MGTGAAATGLRAGAKAAANVGQPMIVLPGVGKMDEAAGIGQAAPGQATASARMSQAGDMTATVGGIQKATGVASIITTRTMGGDLVVFPE